MQRPVNTVPVLVVDDDAVDLKAVQRAFKRFQLPNPLITVTDGREALNVLRGSRAAQTAPGLVLVDLNMPSMGGIELLSEIRSDPKLRRTVVFVVTTSADDSDRAAAYDRGIAGYLVKSELGVDFRKLTDLLRCYFDAVRLPPD